MNTSKIWSRIALKADDDYSSLTEEERVVYNLRKVMDAVNSRRGLIKLYEENDYYYAEESVDDLNAAGLFEVAAIIENANAMFPGGCPPEELEERIEIIDSWDHDFDELFEQWTDDILEFSAEMERSYNELITAFDE